VAELGCTLADEMLRPTIIYAKLAIAMFERFELTGLANITGGGVPENLPRVMPPRLRAEIRRDSWPVPPIFKMIERLGRIERREMDRTFNNGLGMLAVVRRNDADRMVAWLRRRGQAAYIVGEMKRGERGVSFA
jgi:phosphoribosylformylglycinamidine cyclo-ligase